MNEIEKVIYDEVLKLAHRIKSILVAKVVEVIDKENLIATGELRKSMDGEVLSKVDELIIRVFTNAVSPEGFPYPIAVHEGTKPHFPPIEPIAKWVVRKKLSLGDIKRRGSIAKMAESEKIRRIAFAIAKKMSKKGTKGVKFFEIALKEAMPQIENEISKFK